MITDEPPPEGLGSGIGGAARRWLVIYCAVRPQVVSQPTVLRPLPTLTKEIFVANIKSQIKRNLTNEKARLRNKATKSELRTAVRSVRTAVAAGDAEAAAAALAVASRKLDKAASKGVIHKNQAANRKSALAKAASSVAA